MKKSFYSLALLLGVALCFSSTTLAQRVPQYTVQGSVLDEKQQPFPFVNVLLLHAKDSTLARGGVTDEQGAFVFEQVSVGKYLTLVSMVGYQKVYSAPFLVATENLNLGTTALAPDVAQLGEVTIVGQKPFIEQQIDRTVLNVENSIVSAGATALEVLERAPGITVDQQNDRLQLRGKEGVIVQIDGKQTFLSQQELMNLLRNTPSDNIEKIELITNPSAKYDAIGNAGIINIRFKKNQQYGTNGSLTLGVAHARYFRENGALTLNHRAGKLSTYLNASAFYGKGFNETYLYRRIPFEDNLTIFDQSSQRIWKSQNYSIRAGLDYNLTSKTTVGVMLSAFSNAWDTPQSDNFTRILNGQQALQRTFTTQAEAQMGMKNITANTNLRHQFDQKGRELTLDLDYVQYAGQSGNYLDTRYADPSGNPLGAPELVRNDMPSTIHIGVVKLDYTQSIGKAKFETGLKSSYVNTDNNMVFETKLDTWQVDPSRTNQFKYTEWVNAAYGNLSGQLNATTSYQIGLRAEHTYSEGESVTLNQVNERNYLNLFPSVFLSKQLDSLNTLNFSYSRRIDRPNYQSLNPFEFYLDPYTFQRGNPHLRPQLTHSLQLTHVFKSFLTTTLSYSRMNDVIINEVPKQIAAENITYVTPDNLDNQDNLSLTVSLPLPVTKWWSLQTNLTGVYNRFDTFFQDDRVTISQLSYNVYANNQLKLPKGWTAEVSGFYNSASIYGLFSVRPMGMLNLGLQKSVMDKKGTLRLTVNDVFWTNKMRGGSQFQDIDFSIRSLWPSRQARMTFTYRFGNQQVKGARQRQTGASDLQERVNTSN